MATMYSPPSPILSGTIVPLAAGRPGVAQTIRAMRRLVNEGKHDLSLLSVAVTSIYLAPPRDERAEADALLNAVRRRIRYVRDILDIETLAAPATTWARQAGDCDDMATLLATLAELVGYPTRFVVAGYTDPNELEHVFVQILVAGEWLDADPTENGPIGYSPPGALIVYVERV